MTSGRHSDLVLRLKTSVADNDRYRSRHEVSVQPTTNGRSSLRSFRARLASHSNTTNAAHMQRYLKTTQPMYGIKTPPRRDMLKQTLLQYPIDTFDDYLYVVHDLWMHPKGGREEMYAAVDVAGHTKTYKNFCTPKMLPMVSLMVRTAQWWDTLDAVAILAGRMLLQYRPQVEEYLVEWRTHESKWARRASLLAHLKHGHHVNLPLMEETICMLMPERDFFIEKAVGWALRDYARFNPEWVQAFVHKHDGRLAALSKREALKHVGPGQPRETKEAPAGNDTASGDKRAATNAKRKRKRG